MCVIAVSISLCLTAAVVWYFVQTTTTKNSSHNKKSLSFLKTMEDQPQGETIDIRSIRKEVVKLWALPFSSLPVCVDLARLASRVSIFDFRPKYAGSADNYSDSAGNFPESTVTIPGSAEVSCEIEFLLPADEIMGVRGGGGYQSYPDAFQKTSFIISTVANLIENQQMKEKITKIVYAKRGSDSQLWLEKVFEEIGEESKTAQLFKVINQAIIQPVCTSVKKMIFELIHSIPTDVRTPDGWKVFINFYPDNITVTHMRKEEIRGQFSFSWSLSILMNYDLVSLKDVTLSFNSMTYEENFPIHFKEKLN